MDEGERKRKRWQRYYRRHLHEIRARKRESSAKYHAEHRTEVLERAAAVRRANREIGRELRAHAAETGATKRCPKCRETKAVTEFHIDGSRKDGLRAWCKDCHCAYARKRQAERDPREYRRVAKAALGRSLGRGESVHHVNCDDSDHRPENLHVFPSRASHALAHGSLTALVKSLMEAGHIVFDRGTGVYRLGTPG
jgi:hypothetical protein